MWEELKYLALFAFQPYFNMPYSANVEKYSTSASYLFIFTGLPSVAIFSEVISGRLVSKRPACKETMPQHRVRGLYRLCMMCAWKATSAFVKYDELVFAFPNKVLRFQIP